MSGHLPECPADKCTCEPDGFGHMYDCTKLFCICDRLRACEQRVTERWESLRGWGESFAYKTGSDNGFSAGYDAALDAAREAVAALESNPELEIDWDRDYAVDPSGATRNPRVWLRDAVAAIDALREEQSSGGQGILKCSACKCDLQWLSNRLVHLGDASELCDVHMQEQPPPLPPSVGVPTTPMWPAR